MATPRTFLTCLALAALAVAATGRAVGLDRVNYDDPLYLDPFKVLGGLKLDEALAGHPDAFLWGWATTHASHYHPLTWWSLQLDADLFGTAPWGFHLTNVLLHAANTLLLFAALARMTGSPGRSAAAAAGFACHPLHAEPVAWISERKELLAALFGLLAMRAYAAYAERPSAWRMAAVAGWMAASLLCKPMWVTLPFLLLVLDGWPLGRLRSAADLGRLAAEKWPLFLLTAAGCAVAVAGQASGGAVKSLDRFPPADRLANAAVAYAVYLRQTVWPAGLAAYYPHPGRHTPLTVAGSALLLAALTAGAVAAARRRPYLLAGWLWFAGMLVPVIGLVQVGQQAHADHFMYVPLAGLLVAAVWGLADAVPAGRWRAAAGLAVLAAWTGVSVVQVGVWRDSRTLWAHALAHTRDNPLAHHNYAAACPDPAEAEAHLRAAIRLRPDLAQSHFALGQMAEARGDAAAAAGHYLAAADARPDRPGYRLWAAKLLRQLGRAAEADAQERRADGR